MNDKERLSVIQFTVSTVAYIIVFVAVCVSVGFSKNCIMIYNGVFFILYILNLWYTGMATFSFYESGYFIIDMLSIAVYANIPYIFIRELSTKDFVMYSFLLLSINEVICIGWDVLCHMEAKEAAKNFHFRWSLYTALGVMILIVSMILMAFTSFFDQQSRLLLLDILCIGFEFLLLLFWRISEYNIKKKQQDH